MSIANPAIFLPHVILPQKSDQSLNFPDRCFATAKDALPKTRSGQPTQPFLMYRVPNKAKARICDPKSRLFEVKIPVLLLEKYQNLDCLRPSGLFRPYRLSIATTTVLSVGPASASSPTNIFDPAATPAHSIFSLSMLVLSVTLAIFLVVGGLLLYALIRFRHRSTDSEHEPPQIYGSNQIELSWTVIPILIVVMLFLSTTRVILETEAAPKPSSAVDVIIIGHQYWWEYRYPELGVVTANELHIPISDPKHPTPTYLEMSSADVSHSFWVPRLAGKTDLIPNRINTMWIDPPEPGLYLGQCAQYCGTQHAKMLLRVYAESPGDFAAWVSRQQQSAVKDLSDNPLAQEGRTVFLRTACMSCHTVVGTSANGHFGPDLTHLAGRDTIGSGPIENTPQNLRKWIADPNEMKPGSLMPSMHLNDHDLDAITAYLTTLN